MHFYAGPHSLHKQLNFKLDTNNIIVKKEKIDKSI